MGIGMKSQKQKIQELKESAKTTQMFAFDCAITEENEIITHMMIPPHLDGPDLKDLPEKEGQFLMSFASIAKQCEVYAGKFKYNYQGYINGRKVIDRPIPSVIETQ